MKFFRFSARDCVAGVLNAVITTSFFDKFGWQWWAMAGVLSLIWGIGATAYDHFKESRNA